MVGMYLIGGLRRCSVHPGTVGIKASAEKDPGTCWLGPSIPEEGGEQLANAWCQCNWSEVAWVGGIFSC